MSSGSAHTDLSPSDPRTYKLLKGSEEGRGAGEASVLEVFHVADLAKLSRKGEKRGEGGTAGELLSHKLLTILILLPMKVSEKAFFSI